MERWFLAKMEEIRNFKNESRHSTQLNGMGKTRYILYKGANDGRVVSVLGFALKGLRFESRVKFKVVQLHENFCISLFWGYTNNSSLLWRLKPYHYDIASQKHPKNLEQKSAKHLVT
jgi:hypothetical protein